MFKNPQKRYWPVDMEKALPIKEFFETRLKQRMIYDEFQILEQLTY